MTPKNTTKQKETYCDQSHSPAPKRAKVIKGQKLAKSIHIVIEKLKLSCKKKSKSTKREVKDLIKLYRSNGRLLAVGLTLLQNDCKVPIFFSFNRNNQKL